jgi:hypothetical protein
MNNQYFELHPNKRNFDKGTNMKIHVSNKHMEDEYTITINGDMVKVENISIPDSCSINIKEFQDNEDGSILKAFQEQDWNSLISELIATGYLK